MIFSPLHHHDPRRRGKENSSSQELNQGTAELLRNILGLGFHDYEKTAGDSLCLPKCQQQVTQADVATPARQLQGTKETPIGRLSGPDKEFFFGYVLETHEKNMESNP